MLLSSLYPPVGRGGAEKAASLLAEALARRGHQVSVITFHDEKAQSFEERNGVRIYRIAMDNVYWPFGRSAKESSAMRLLWHLFDIWNRRAAKRVGRILDQERPDVVHSHVIAGFSVAVWREVRRRNIRLVHTLHDYYMLCVRSSLFRDGRQCEQRCTECEWMTRVRKNASHEVDEVVSVSDFVLREHRRFGYFNQVPGSVLFNVMDAHLVPPVQEGRRPDDTLVFGFIGKLEEPKGIEVLLAATQRLSVQNWRLRIAGQGIAAYVSELKTRYPDPRVEWLGFMPSEEFYRSVNVAVIPSIWSDPLPYVTLEALFAGKSILCAQSGGIPEVARLARVADLFPAGDVNALAVRMEAAISHPQHWCQGGFLHPESAQLFADTRVADAYEACYRGPRS